MPKLNDSWTQWGVSILFAVGAFVGISRGHVNEAQAMRIVEERSKKLCFPLVDGEVLKKDLEHVKYLLKRQDIKSDAILGLINEDQARKELNKLKDEFSKIEKKEKPKALSFNNPDCPQRYSCNDALFTCHLPTIQ